MSGASAPGKSRRPSRCASRRPATSLPRKTFPKDRNRQEEARAGVDPSGAVWREAAHRDDAVDVGMMLEPLPPRVEHHQPADGGAEAFWIRGDPQQRLRGRPKQQVVDDALVRERQARQRLRHREDDVDIAHGQELRLPRRHPGVPRGGQTLRGQCRSRQLLYERAGCAHCSHRSRCPPSAAVRHCAMARSTRRCARSPTPGGSPGSDRHVGARCRPPRRVAASPRVLQPRPPRGVRPARS